MAGVIAAANGASYLVPEELGLAIAINFPVCAISAAINVMLD